MELITPNPLPLLLLGLFAFFMLRFFLRRKMEGRWRINLYSLGLAALLVLLVYALMLAEMR